MSEKKKGIHQTSPNSFLFFISPEIFYFLCFEIKEGLKIKINIIKIMIKETYVYENIVPFNILGTNDSSPQDTIRTLSYLFNNFDFIIKEEENKIILFINNKSKASIELLLYNGEKDIKKKDKYMENINNIQKRIKDLLIIIGKQEERMNELKKNEENHKILITKLEQITTSISKKLDNSDININYNNEKNNGQFNNNNYNNNTQNINSNFSRTISFSGNYSNKNNLNNIINNNNSNIKINYNSPYNTCLPGNINGNILLTHPQNKIPSKNVYFEKRQVMNLDKIKNYKK